MPIPDAPQKEPQSFDLLKFKQDFLATFTANPSTPTEIISPTAIEVLIGTITENPSMIAKILQHACHAIASTEAFAKLYDTISRYISIPTTDGPYPTPTEFVSPKLAIAVITEIAKRLSAMKTRAAEDGYEILKLSQTTAGQGAGVLR
mgnify:CR=1 FL=1